MKDFEEKLYLAKNITRTGIVKIQTLATKSQTKMRMGKHVSSNDLGGKSARRKKKRETPYGKALSNVKFWSEVRALKKSLELYNLDGIEDYKEDALRLFNIKTYGLTAIQKNNQLMVFDERELRKYNKD